jgi:hypothetical protein
LAAAQKTNYSHFAGEISMPFSCLLLPAFAKGWDN